MSTTLSKLSRPSIVSYGAGSVLARFKSRAAIWYKVSLMSVDLPEPDTPVTHVINPTGIVRFTFFRLFPAAPFNSITCIELKGVRCSGTSINCLPDRYCPVNDFLFAAICFGVPCATISPPCTPAPGPISITWSAALIASSSCSTTITVLPKSRRWNKVFNKRWLSRWCKPIDGSSRIYITPTSPAPIWLAKRIRWASPPDNVSALRSRVK